MQGRLDASTNCAINLDYEHHETHGGSHYYCFYNSSSIALNNTIEMLVIASPEPKEPHTVFIANSDGDATLEVFRGTTVSANGTALAVNNRNHNSSKTANTLCYHTPTVTDDGTVFFLKYIGSGKNVGGESRSSSEFVLEHGGNYLIRLTANANPVKGVIGIDFYEHDNWSDGHQ